LLKKFQMFCVCCEPVDYWPVVGKFAESLELSYLDTQQRLHEEAETLSAFAGLSVVSATSTSQIDFLQCVYLFVNSELCIISCDN